MLLYNIKIESPGIKKIILTTTLNFKFISEHNEIMRVLTLNYKRIMKKAENRNQVQGLITLVRMISIDSGRIDSTRRSEMSNSTVGTR